MTRDLNYIRDMTDCVFENFFKAPERVRSKLNFWDGFLHLKHKGYLDCQIIMPCIYQNVSDGSPRWETSYMIEGKFLGLSKNWSQYDASSLDFCSLSLENQKFYSKYYLQTVFDYDDNVREFDYDDNVRDFAVIAITEDEVYNLKNNYYAEWVDDLEKDRLIIFNRLFSLSFYTGIFTSDGGDKDVLSNRLFYDIAKDLIDKYGDDIRGFILVPLHLCFFYSETVEEIKNDLKIMLEKNYWYNFYDSIFIQKNYTDLNGLGRVIYKPNFVRHFEFNQLLE